MFCPKCGTNNETTAVYCLECGLKLPDNQAEQQDINLTSAQNNIEVQPTVLICAKCGSNNEYEAVFCAECGESLTGGNYIKENVSAVSVQKYNDNKLRPIIAICTNCDEVIEEGDIFCAGCGRRVEQTQVTNSVVTNLFGINETTASFAKADVKENRTTKYIAVVAGIVAVLGIIIWLLSQNTSNNSFHAAMPPPAEPASVQAEIKPTQVPNLSSESPQGLTPEPTLEPMPVPTSELTPDYEPKTLTEAIFDTENWVRITINRLNNGGVSIFERDKNTSAWLMRSRDGYTRLLDPIFRVSGNTLYIGFPTGNTEYSLLDASTDISGSGTDLGGVETIWTMETDSVTSLGNIIIDATENLSSILSQNVVIAIYVSWGNRQNAILYRTDSNVWHFKNRNGNYYESNINPVISDNSSGAVFMSFTRSSSNYSFEFYDGGSGISYDENMTWSCTYLTD